MNAPAPAPSLRKAPPRIVPVSIAAPGRLRVRVEGLRRRPLIALRIQDCLAGESGVRHVQASAVTGSVLILFDPRRTGARRLIACVRAYLCEPTGEAGESPGGLPAWHAQPAEAVVARLETSAGRGLSSETAADRLVKLGANRLPSPQPSTALQIIAGHLSSLPVMLLGGAAVLSLATGAPLEALAILGVVAANTTVGYLTESRVERTLASLQDGAPAPALTRREGELLTVHASRLVPGDVLVLAPGSDVAADARLLEASGLALDQSSLTGESLPAVKAVAAAPSGALLTDRTSMVYAGTRVVEGSGLAVVTATGRHTEIGRVRTLVAATPTRATPLERQLDRVGRRLVGVSLGLCGVALGLGLVRGIPALEMVRTAVSLAVAAVPEGLPAVATATLALGMQRMMRQGMLVRRLSAVESLGATTVICADKTGTLTENRMTVDSWYLAGREYRNGAVGAAADRDEALARALAIGVLCNEAELDHGGTEIRGSSTEGALLTAAMDAGVDYRHARASYPLLSLRRRADSDRWMGSVHADGVSRRFVAVKGAPEQVVRLASRWYDGRTERPMTVDSTRDILVANARMAARGLRVLALAYREDEDVASEPSYDGLVWIGLVALTDPVRPGVREAIAACRLAGIRTVILTGDQAATAAAISRELELHEEEHPRALDAAQLADGDIHDLRRHARRVDVFSRVSPADKYHIVSAFQANGEIVAMTGDGINDAAALRAADIGVAMGAGGTDLAREVADVVLLDDDLGAIVKAVEQGRSIRSNIGRALQFLLSTNLSEILVTIGALGIGMARPISAMQFLWINLLSDVAPALALAVEPADPELMTRPPDDPAEPLLSRPVMTRVVRDGAVLAVAALGIHAVALGRYGSGPRANTVTFSTLTAAQLVHALQYRARGGSAAGSAPSPLLSSVVGASLALQAAAVMFPPLRRLLGLAPLSLGDWLLVGGGAAAPFAFNEIRRAVGPSRPSR